MGLLDRILTEQIKASYERNKKPAEPGILGALADPQFRQDVKRGLLDSINRGAVASTIGGPVDLATMALRPLGYNVEKPVLGSEWVGDKMQQMGLLGETRNPIAEALASVAVPGAMSKAGKGLFNETAYQTKTPKIPQKLGVSVQSGGTRLPTLSPDGVTGSEAFRSSDSGPTITNAPNFVYPQESAIDPARVNENDMLGRATPRMLGLLASGGGGLAVLQNNRKQ